MRRHIPAPAWCCALRAHPLVGDTSDDEWNGDGDMSQLEAHATIGGSSSCHAPLAPRVPCVAVISSTEKITSRGGGNRKREATQGSCLRTATSRVIPGPRTQRDAQGALGREHSVLRCAIGGDCLSTFEIPDENTLLTSVGHRAKKGSMEAHKSRLDNGHSCFRALAEARDLSMLFGHAAAFGYPVQWESVTCFVVVPGVVGHDIDDPNPQVEVAEMPRLWGAFLLKNVWDLVDHSGSIPDDEEREAADSYFAHVGNDRRYSLERILPQGRSVEEESTVAHAAASSTTRSVKKGSTAAHAVVSSTDSFGRKVRDGRGTCRGWLYGRFGRNAPGGRWFRLCTILPCPGGALPRSAWRPTWHMPGFGGLCSTRGQGLT